MYRVIDRNSLEVLMSTDYVDTLTEAVRIRDLITEVETKIQKFVDGQWESLDIDNSEFGHIESTRYLVDLVEWMSSQLGNHVESSVSPWSDLTNYRDKYENGEVWRQLVHRKYWTGTVSIGDWSWAYSDREDSEHSEEEVASVYKLFHVYHPLNRAN